MNSGGVKFLLNQNSFASKIETHVLLHCQSLYGIYGAT